MSVIDSTVDSHSQEFEANVAAMEQLVEQWRGIELQVIKAAEKKVGRYREQGLIPPRERLGLLLDPGAAFLDLATLCGYRQEGDGDGSAAGGSTIGGIGYISGIRCVVIVDDYLTKGGSFTQLGMEKRQRLMAIAMAQKLPLVCLAQSGGGNLAMAGDFFGASGAGFAAQARLSAAGIPQITVVHGAATAGGAYQPGLSDYVIMIRKQSTMYLAGPPLLKAATGEIASEEQIGGAQMHGEVSGVADYLAENDSDGIRIAREVMAKLDWNRGLSSGSRQSYAEPRYRAQELLGLVPRDPRTPYDVREIIARIADGSDYLDFKADFDHGTVCGHIDIQGHACGVIGNNAPITPAGANKATQFIQLCQQSDTPILFLHNTTGFIVGTEAEQQGIIKHGAKLIQAVTNSTVTKISVVIGGSYGAGNYAMCGRGMAPDFIFAWPGSVVSITGPEQAGSVMRTVAEAKMKRTGTVDKQQLDTLEQQIAERLFEKSRALANTARLWDDGMIDPRDTRAVVGFVLSVCRQARQRELKANSFGIARM